MAAKTVEKLIRELDCAVCMNTLKNPKSLLCRHSFCEECLKHCNNTSQSNSGEIKCPMCREVTTLSGEGVADLKSNPLICRVLEVLEAKKNSTQIMCDACGDSELPLTTYCRDCFHFICDSCASSHAKMKLLMKDHRTVALDKIENGTIKINWMEEGLWRKPHECGEHSGELRRFFCRTCKIRICRDCIVLDHTKPDHDCTTVQKMFQETQEVVKDRLKSCKEKEEHVSTMLNDVDVRETGASQKFHMMKERIQDLKSTAVANLNKTEEELLQKIEVLEEKLNNKLQAFRDNMNTTKENLTRAQSKAKEVVLAKEVTDISRGPFLPEDVLKELEELIASDVTMTISMDLMALKATMIQESKLPEQIACFAKLSLPHIWRETYIFPIPDKDIVKIFSDGKSMYVACKKGIYKKLLSYNAYPSTWRKLHHNASIKQVVDMTISVKDQTFSFIAVTEAACTQLFRLKLDDFPTYHGHGVPSSSGSTVTPCPLNSSARITVDSQFRIIVAENNPSTITDPAPSCFGFTCGQASADTASLPSSLGSKLGQPSADLASLPSSLGSKLGQPSADLASLSSSLGSKLGQPSADLASLPSSLGSKLGQPSADLASLSSSLGSKLGQPSADLASLPSSLGSKLGQPSAGTASLPSSLGSKLGQPSADLASLPSSLGSKLGQPSADLASLSSSLGSKLGQPSADLASLPSSLGSKLGQPSADLASLSSSLGSKLGQPSADLASLPSSLGSKLGQPSADLASLLSSLGSKLGQASADTASLPSSLGSKLGQPSAGTASLPSFSFGPSSQTASAGTFKFSSGKTENKPSSSASNGKGGKAESGLPIPTTSTAIYRVKPGNISSPSMQYAGLSRPASSQLSSDSFKVPLDRVRSLAAAKSGQLVFLRGDKKAVVITDKDGRIQHEIKEPGRMYLSISCTESDALFVLSAFWGSHIVTLTKHSLEDGCLLEYIIDELDVSANFQSDDWPVIGNHGNDLVVINIGDEIRVYSAEDWD